MFLYYILVIILLYYGANKRNRKCTVITDINAHSFSFPVKGDTLMFLYHIRAKFSSLTVYLQVCPFFIRLPYWLLSKTKFACIEKWYQYEHIHRETANIVKFELPEVRQSTIVTYINVNSSPLLYADLANKSWTETMYCEIPKRQLIHCGVQIRTTWDSS